jgi:hypothetical protein
MIDIEIIGCSSKQKRSLFDLSIRHYCNALIPRYKNICVDLYLGKINCDAYCTRIENKFFIIELHDSISFEIQLKSLAHECVHMKQFIRNELKECYGKFFWKGAEYEQKLTNRSSITEMDEYTCYSETPWEQEAFTLENELYFNFYKEYNVLIDKVYIREHKKNGVTS